jgi:hypothetical protein
MTEETVVEITPKTNGTAPPTSKNAPKSPPKTSAKSAPTNPTKPNKKWKPESKAKLSKTMRSIYKMKKAGTFVPNPIKAAYRERRKLRAIANSGTTADWQAIQKIARTPNSTTRSKTSRKSAVGIVGLESIHLCLKNAAIDIKTTFRSGEKPDLLYHDILTLLAYEESLKALGIKR